MKVLFTITIMITILGALSWSLEAIGYNLVDRWVTSKNVKNIIYYIISVCALITLVIFFRDKLYEEEK